MLGLLGFRREVVYDHEYAVRYDDGKLVGLIEAGRHWVRRRKTFLCRVDRREMIVNLSGQEVLSSDGVTVRITITVEFRVADPILAVTSVQDYMVSLYAKLQIALRDAVGSLTIEEFLAARRTIGAQLTVSVKEAAAEIGLELVSADVRDVMFPGELKQIFAQVAGARQEGLAALERARGETAALRSLANAARMIDDNPNLLQLRMLQEMGQSEGNTFVVGDPLNATASANGHGSA